jgi:hypothetical protein
MPSPIRLTRFARLARLATMPETRGVIAAAARSDIVRDVARRASNDRAGLARDLTNPANARAIARSAVRHPATAELANAGLMFLPIRYMPIGWAATWAAHRILRRFVDPPVEVLDPSAFGAKRELRNVTPDVTPDVPATDGATPDAASADAATGQTDRSAPTTPDS